MAQQEQNPAASFKDNATTEGGSGNSSTPGTGDAREKELLDVLHRSSPEDAARRFEREPDELVARVLAAGNPALADELLWELDDAHRERVLAAAGSAQREQWQRNHAYADGTVGRLMAPPTAVLRPEQTVGETIERLRAVVKKALVTYGWVVDEGGKLVGVVVFRELLFATHDQLVQDVMLKDPFSLRPEMTLTEAMRAALERHFPAYPVCDDAGRFLGIVRGQSLFEQQAFELSAQAGALVGVEKEERLDTPWHRSLRFRHPWLQLNLLTAFAAAAVVGTFEDTLDKLVILAVFLPVLAGQSGNTGCQALAVALRGITLGELDASRARRVVGKEALLGFLNGSLVGISAGAGMYIYASSQGSASALALAGIVWMAMVGACTVSGLAGALVPLALRRAGADPATASSIFLTTATDVVSMGLFLMLATVFLL